MKKILFFFLILAMTLNTHAATGVILKPSLVSQMKLQEKQNIKANNAQKLALLRTQKLATKKTVTPTKTVSTNSKSTISSNKTTIQGNAWLIPRVNSITLSNNQPAIMGVDMDKVRSTWLWWYNDVRRNLWLQWYAFDSKLDATAYDWNKVFASGRWQNHHRRNPWDVYYDYSKITSWFKERGVVGKVVNGATTTENVWWGTYSCSSSDCTDNLIRSIRSTFDFFMSEKSYNGAHYRSVMSSAFTKIGLSVIVEPSERRYYLVVHYITEFE